MTKPGGTRHNQPAAARVPPHDLAAEEALLGSAILRTEALRILATQTRPDDFYAWQHKQIASALTELYAAGEPADATTLADRLGKDGLLEQIGGPQAIVPLITAPPSSTNAAAYARIVTERAQRRRLIGLAGDLAEAGYQGTDTAAIVDELAASNQNGADQATKYLSGAAWILDQPPGIPAVWGRDDEILWAQGEPLLIVGPTGVGKTTLVQQVVLARLGLADDVIGFPVAPTDHPVLYLACDRPKQIARSFRRAVGPDDASLLDRLVIWQGPPPQDFAKHPRSIVDMANTVGAKTVFIDSLKDVAAKLSEDETGAGLNRAIQNAIAEDIEIASLHHQRKGQGGVKPRTLEDIYGSIWIPAGAGSVILLWGKGGDLTIELSHLKQPASPVGPLELVHDHDTAATTVARGPIDALHILRTTPAGLTSVDLAQRGSPEGSPSVNDVRRAKRQLDKLVKAGLAHLVKGQSGGDANVPDRYHAIALQEEF